MKLSEGDESVIKTIAVFVNYQDLLDKKVITKDMFDEAYAQFDEAQKVIISGFLSERMAFNEKLIKRLGNTIGKRGEVSTIAITRLIMKYDDRPDEEFEEEILRLFRKLKFEKIWSVRHGIMSTC